MNGFFRVTSGGSFFTRFSVSYNYNGITKTINVSSIPLGFTKQINVPINATNVSITIEAGDGTNYKVVRQSSYNDAVQRCFETYGDATNPICKEIRCKALGSTSTNSNNKVSATLEHIPCCMPSSTMTWSICNC